MVTKAILSVFTSPTCRGNPAGVVLSDAELPWAERRRLAIELNQPATAFVTGTGTHLAWHSRAGEALPLCGHGTAAAVHFLSGETGAGDGGKASKTEFTYSFEENEGGNVVKGTIVGTHDGRRFGVDIPCGPQSTPMTDAAVISEFCDASGLQSGDVECAVTLPTGYSEEGATTNLALRLAPSVDLGHVKVDIAAIKRMPFRGVWITSLCPSPSSPHDTRETRAAIRSRTFFPRTGLDEDEVCGSAHAFLVPWWVRSLPEVFAEYKTPEGWRVPAVQLSPRGGVLEVHWDGKTREEGGRCTLSGEGVVDSVQE